mmetsp:Transcript_103490/g.292146  ORF Transcript_103490/g.292146 Transcript_103490/m.292146 type:complete len:245 (-) Transcript_103490:270-1004(-)
MTSSLCLSWRLIDSRSNCVRSCSARNSSAAASSSSSTRARRHSASWSRCHAAYIRLELSDLCRRASAAVSSFSQACLCNSAKRLRHRANNMRFAASRFSCSRNHWAWSWTSDLDTSRNFSPSCAKNSSVTFLLKDLNTRTNTSCSGALHLPVGPPALAPSASRRSSASRTSAISGSMLAFCTNPGGPGERPGVNGRRQPPPQPRESALTLLEPRRGVQVLLAQSRLPVALDCPIKGEDSTIHVS